MANRLLKLAPSNGKALTNQSALNDFPEAPFLDYNFTVDKNINGYKETFDGYQFETDWNGSKNVLTTGPNSNIFSSNYNTGLMFTTTESIGKDRSLMYQFWGKDTNLFLPNVIGYTGLWRNGNRQYHPRLEMVVFHYCNSSGNRTADYKVDNALRSHNESSHYWNYGNTGQHDSGSDWYIGYTVSSSRRDSVVTNGWRLFGMSIQIKYRTAASNAYATGTFWNWKPIIGPGASLSSASDCKKGTRMVIPAIGNTYPVGDSSKILLY